MENQARGMPEPEVGERQYNPRRFRAVDVQDLFEDARRQPVPQLAPGRSVYRRSHAARRCRTKIPPPTRSRCDPAGPLPALSSCGFSCENPLFFSTRERSERPLVLLPVVAVTGACRARRSVGADDLTMAWRRSSTRPKN